MSFVPEPKFTKLIYILLFFSIFGIFFIGGIIEEIYHVLTMKGATQICYPLNVKINDSLQNGYLMLYTSFNMSKYDNLEEFDTLREQSEKDIMIIRECFNIISALIVGFISAIIINKY